MDSTDPVIVSWSLSIGFVGAVRRGTWEIDREGWNCSSAQEREDMLDEMYKDEISNYIDGGWEVDNAGIDDPTS